MQHTLVAVFDNRGDAQNAMDELLGAGFGRGEVRLSEGDPAGSAGAAGTSTRAEDDGSITASIKHFFSDLFGSAERDSARLYSDAVTRGHYVLTLIAADEPEVERAADIVERHGPVDIDEQAAQWAGGRAGFDTARSSAQSQAGTQQQSMQSGAQGSAQSAGTQSAGAQQGAAAQDSQQRAIPVVQEELKVGKREVQRGGVRVYSRVVETPVNESVGLREEHVNVQRRVVDEPLAADAAAFQETSIELRETAEEPVIEKTARVVEQVIVGKEVTQREEKVSDTVRRTEVEVEQLRGDDDAYYRGHWNANYANTGDSYDDYAPAYRYGSSMARSDQYRGRQWDTVEGGLRSDWERSNPGSAWDKFKAAIRHGWERMTS
ncbi:MAG TPA: YsnF/AvaK domain-containing protein [Telluria sp.]|nr:YsnF/AvaK domain-containing protein [Telluria sp.]